MKRVEGISVVIPAFNSEESLALVVEQLEAVLPKVARRHEILLVDDCSRDGTLAVARRLAAANPRVRAVGLRRNFGQHNALLCGIRLARHGLSVTIDDDLQHPPAEIPRLLRTMEETGADVVYGAPRRERHSAWRTVASRVTKLTLQHAMGAETAGSISAFRLLRTDLRDAFGAYDSPLVNIDVLLTWGTSRFAVCRVKHLPRTLGTSNYTFGRLATHTLNMLTGFSTWPLRAASMLGFGLTLFGAALLAYVVGRYLLQGTTVAGFPFLASTISIFSGAQMLALGIIGEYLARMHLRSMGRPAFVVREDSASGKGDDAAGR